MSKMKELATVLDELVTCGETLISMANSLREIFSTEAPESDDAAKATEKSSAEKQPSGTENYQPAIGLLADYNGGIRRKAQHDSKTK